MEAEKKAAALKAAALVDKPPHALIAVSLIIMTIMMLMRIVMIIITTTMMMRERKSGRRGEGAGYSDKIYVNGIGDTKLGCSLKILIFIILWTWQVNVDSREAELSWLGTWLVYFLVATVEIIISAANTTFNQVRIL